MATTKEKTNEQSSEKASESTSEVTNYVVENFKQLILSIQNEVEIKSEGLLETASTISKEVQEKINKMDSITELRIDDNYHISHNINVASLSVAIGAKMGLKQEELKRLSLCCLVHDIGKIKIPMPILLKPDKLSPKEYELVKLHVPLGVKMAKEELMLKPEICKIILQHHERFDGTGYPKGISGHDLHIFSQIIAVTDCFDALSSERIYARPKSPKEIIKELLSTSSKFNPQVLQTLIYMV